MRPRGPDGRVHGSRKQLLTEEQVAAVKAAWMLGLSRDDVARATGLTVARLKARLDDQLAFLPRRGKGKGGGRRRQQEQDPTEEEIWGRLVIEQQAKWTDDEREQRWKGKFNHSDDET